MGDRRRETRDGRQEVGDKRWETGDGRRKTGDRRQETEGRQGETGNSRQETGDRRGFYDVKSCGAGTFWAEPAPAPGSSSTLD